MEGDDRPGSGREREPGDGLGGGLTRVEVGAVCLGGGRARFTVWAPKPAKVELRLLGDDNGPERLLPMARDALGYWRTEAEAAPGTRYFYRLTSSPGSSESAGSPESAESTESPKSTESGGRSEEGGAARDSQGPQGPEDETVWVDRPDPASHSQPEGVHGPSLLVDHDAFPWPDERPYAARPLRDWIVYELHVGTFTPEGTFDAVIPRLDELVELGATCVELMPAAQFPGRRNWGYDGVQPFAPQNSYGGPDGLKRLVAACHERDLAVVLDVVYNHFGPEGNYSEEFAPYFTDHYKTPWGRAVNFDAEESHGVRAYFLANVRHWLSRYRFDGLRLDAVHSIYDLSARHILADLAAEAKALSAEERRPLVLVAESDLNDARLVRPPEVGGLGLDGQWNDDFHHALHALVTDERQGYYAAFGRVGHLARCLEDRFVYSGQWNAYRRRAYGAPAADVPPERFVVFAQNHDQIGNRMLGERMSRLSSFGRRKVMAGVLLLSPFTPMLFMGEEYGEENPFLYFVDHSDDWLRDAVRQGRAEEFRAFDWAGEPPDPAAEETFRRSVLNWDRRREGHGKALLALHRRLVSLRGRPSFAEARGRARTAVFEREKALLLLLGQSGGPRLFCAFAFGETEAPLSLAGFLPNGRWRLLVDSESPEFGGGGALAPAELNAPEADRLAIGPERFAAWELV